MGLITEHKDKLKQLTERYIALNTKVDVFRQQYKDGTLDPMEYLNILLDSETELDQLKKELLEIQNQIS